MSYPDDAEYPYVDLAELADLPDVGIDADAFGEWADVVKGGDANTLPYRPPHVPEEDDE